MLQELLNIVIVGAQMAGLLVLAWGCFVIAAATFSGQYGGLVRGSALVLIGAYLAGFGGSLR